MKELREIGLEKEMFLIRVNKTDLLAKDEIEEPKLYGFPYDEMGFLVELRSLPSDRLYPIVTTLFNEELQYKLRANKFGMELNPAPYMYAESDFVEHIISKYKILEFPNYTRNIYGIKENHHLGVFSEEGTNCSRLTAGIHVHFSSRRMDTGEVIELPVEEIVKKMDKVFKKEIEETNRIKGEWEPKTHGFEYRSLPCNTDITKIIKESFEILRNV